MTADYDFDRDVDDADLDLMMGAIRVGSTNWLYDLAGDGGAADRKDLDVAVFQLVFTNNDPADRGTAYGDANLNGYVDDDDLSLLLANWLIGRKWRVGNFIDNDPSNVTVNDDDLSLLLANWTGRRAFFGLGLPRC